MKRKNRLVRLFRAISGMTQRAFAARTRIHHVLLAGYELDGPEPSQEHLASAAEGAGLTVAAGEQVLDFAEALRQQRRRAGLGPDDLTNELAALSARVYQRLLRQPLPDPPPTPEDERRFEEQWAVLKTLPENQQEAIVRIAPELRRRPAAAPRRSSDPESAPSGPGTGRTGSRTRWWESRTRWCGSRTG